MSSKIVSLNTDKRRFFLSYLTLLKPVLDNYYSSKYGEAITFPPVELELLSQLLYYNDKFKHIEIEDRMKIILHVNTMKELVGYLSIRDNSWKHRVYYARISSLKRKKIVTNEGFDKFVVALLEKPTFDLVIRFNITDYENSTKD